MHIEGGSPCIYGETLGPARARRPAYGRGCSRGFLFPGGVSQGRLIKEYYEKHPRVLVLGILITFGISLVGWFLGGHLGGIVGFTLSIAYFIGGPPYRTHIRSQIEGNLSQVGKPENG